MSGKNFLKDRNVMGSIVCSGIVGLVFIILRLTAVINWSWWAVTAPFWALISHWILAGITRALTRGRNDNEVSAFVGLSGILNIFVVFLVLRLLGVINWRWWIITIPLWIGIGLTLLTCFGFAMQRRFGDGQKQE